MSISFRFTSHGILFLPARMGKYPTFLFGRSLGNRARARPWVMILSLGRLCSRYSPAVYRCNRPRQALGFCVVTSVTSAPEAAPLQGHPFGHRSSPPVFQAY